MKLCVWRGEGHRPGRLWEVHARCGVLRAPLPLGGACCVATRSNPDRIPTLKINMSTDSYLWEYLEESLTGNK